MRNRRGRLDKVITPAGTSGSTPFSLENVSSSLELLEPWKLELLEYYYCHGKRKKMANLRGRIYLKFILLKYKFHILNIAIWIYLHVSYFTSFKSS